MNEQDFRELCAEVHRLALQHGAGLPAVMRDAVELTACLYLAQWIALQQEHAKPQET